MRRFISFVFATALCLGGAYLLWAILASTAGWRGWMVMGAALMLGLGGYWVWVDFIAPTPGRGGSDASRS